MQEMVLDECYHLCQGYFYLGLKQNPPVLPFNLGPNRKVNWYFFFLQLIVMKLSETGSLFWDAMQTVNRICMGNIPVALPLLIIAR